MAGDWTATKWGEIATLAYGKALSGYSKAYGSARVYGTNGPIGWHDEARWDGPGVIVGRKGAYRGVHYTTGPYWVIDTAYSLRPKVDLSLRWAYYQLKYLDVNNIDDGSPIPSTTRDAFYAQDLLLPPREDQDRIAEVLSSLDDKVELNLCTAATLEKMAQALFKSWFVDFDPVSAKAEGHPTGLPDATTALFPERFGEDGLPEGWRLGSVADIIEVNPSLSLKAGTPATYVDMASLPTSGPSVSGFISRETSSGSRFQQGDTLVARITPCLENGKTALVDFLDDQEVGWGSTEFIVLRARAPMSHVWPYLLARDDAFRAHLIAAMTGSSGRQRVPHSAVAAWEMALPPARVLAAFAAEVEPLFERISALNAESTTLRALRDTLLPKLISGELRIKDVGATGVAA
ncbi:UNVERIFIED_ORG: type I restriction enzyme S subunit [Rhizobium etli]